MAWDPVPFWIGGGAIHSDAVVRLLADYGVNDSEGILRAGDLKVSALSTPGASVQVATGACSMLGRGSSQANEAYVARMATLDTIGIAATGAGAGRSDLVIGRVEDPNIAGSGWSAPQNVSAGPYMFTRVISGVPNTTRSVLDLNLGYTAVTLARIDIPASTSAITNAMIVDLRKMASPKKDRRLYTVNPGTVYNLTSASYVNWGFGLWQIDIPTWAVRAVLVARVDGARLDRLTSSSGGNGTANGAFRVALGSLVTQAAAYDQETSYTNVVGRFSLGAGDTVAIPANLRGTTQTLSLQGNKSNGNKNIYADTASFGSVDIEFQETTI